jgi:hypothetical protein
VDGTLFWQCGPSVPIEIRQPVLHDFSPNTSQRRLLGVAIISERVGHRIAPDDGLFCSTGFSFCSRLP